MEKKWKCKIRRKNSVKIIERSEKGVKKENKKGLKIIKSAVKIRSKKKKVTTCDIKWYKGAKIIRKSALKIWKKSVVNISRKACKIKYAKSVVKISMQKAGFVLCCASTIRSRRTNNNNENQRGKRTNKSSSGVERAKEFILCRWLSLFTRYLLIFVNL